MSEDVFAWTDGIRPREHALEEENTRLRGLLERLIEAEGMIVFAAPNCKCGDCELVREIEEELAE